jgi:hypothetical protein
VAAGKEAASLVEGTISAEELGELKLRFLICFS